MGAGIYGNIAQPAIYIYIYIYTRPTTFKEEVTVAPVTVKSQNNIWK